MARSPSKERRFETLCTPHVDDLRRYAFWLCRDRTLAADVVQEVLVRAWKSLDSLESEAAVKPWLLTIVRREVARTYERKRLDTVELEEPSIVDDPALALRDDPDADDLRQALLTLDLIYREPLVLQVWFGYSTAEIAEQLEISVPAVLTRLFRARQMLREALE
jgi:RNA polymerase sigma-70 factor (ECF subfamily)